MPAATPASTALPPASSILKPGVRGGVVAGGDHVAGAGDDGTVGGHDSLGMMNGMMNAE